MAASMTALRAITSHFGGNGTPRVALATRQPARKAKQASSQNGMRPAWGITTSARQMLSHRLRSRPSVQSRVSGCARMAGGLAVEQSQRFEAAVTVRLALVRGDLDARQHQAVTQVVRLRLVHPAAHL